MPKGHDVSPDQNIDQDKPVDSTSSLHRSHTSVTAHYQRMIAAGKYAQEQTHRSSAARRNIETHDFSSNELANALNEITNNCDQYKKSFSVITSKVKCLQGMIKNYHQGNDIYQYESQSVYSQMKDFIDFQNRMRSELTESQANMIMLAYEYVKDFTNLFDKGYKDWNKARNALDNMKISRKSDNRSNNGEETLSEIRYHIDWLDGIHFATCRIQKPPILDKRNNLYTGEHKVVAIDTFEHPGWQMRVNELHEIFKDPEEILNNLSLSLIRDTKEEIIRMDEEMKNRTCSEGFNAGVKKAKEIYYKATGFPPQE